MVLDPGVCSGLILRTMNRLKHTICLALLLFVFMGQGVASAADRMACCERGLMVTDTSMNMSMDMPCHGDMTENDITVDTCCKDMATGPVISDLSADISLPEITADRVEVADGTVTPGRMPEYIPPPPNA